MLFIFYFIQQLKRLSWNMENGRRGRNWSVMQPQLMAYPQGNLQDLEKCRHNFPRQKEADWQVLLNRASATACECLAVPPWVDVRAFTIDTDIQATGKLGHWYKYERCVLMLLLSRTPRFCQQDSVNAKRGKPGNVCAANSSSPTRITNWSGIKGRKPNESQEGNSCISSLSWPQVWPAVLPRLIPSLGFWMLHVSISLTRVGPPRDGCHFRLLVLEPWCLSATGPLHFQGICPRSEIAVI